MSYPYRIMRDLASSAGDGVFFALEERLLRLQSRTKRRLQAGLPVQKAEDFRTLLAGCEAAIAVLHDLPNVIERFDETDDPA